MSDDLYELESLAKFRVSVQLFSLPLKSGPANKDNPFIRWKGSYETNKNISFEKIEEYVKNNLPEDKKQLLDILYNDMFLPDENFVPEVGVRYYHVKASKLFKLDAGMSYICVLRRF